MEKKIVNLNMKDIVAAIERIEKQIEKLKDYPAKLIIDYVGKDKRLGTGKMYWNINAINSMENEYWIKYEPFGDLIKKEQRKLKEIGEYITCSYNYEKVKNEGKGDPFWLKSGFFMLCC